MAARDKLSGQFDEYSWTQSPGEIIVPRSRFRGLTGLVQDLGGRIPYDTPGHLFAVSDDVGNAVGLASSSGNPGDFPIHNLMAQHHLERPKARSILQSIRSKGFTPDNDITVIADDDDYGIVVDGHHRALAARAAGMKKIPARRVRFEDVANNMPEDYF